jgi:hypothetical protein
LDWLEQSAKELGTRFSTITMFMIAALAVIPALLATMLPFYGASGFTASLWGPLAMGFSTFALAWSLVGSAAEERKRMGWLRALLPAVLAAAFFLFTLWFTYPPTAAYVEGFAGDARQLRQDVVSARDRISSLSDIVNDVERQQAVDRALLPELSLQIRELRAELRELREQGLSATEQ